MTKSHKPNNLNDDFYLEQNLSTPPKEYFKYIVNIVGEFPLQIESWHDIGCGSGDFLKYLGDRFPDLKLSGSDISPELIKLAKQKCPDIQFRVEDFTAERDPEYFSSCDVTSLLGVHGRFKYIDDWLPHFTSRIKSGGYGLIFDLFNPEPVNVSVSASCSELERMNFENTYFNLVSRASVIKELDSLGFKSKFFRFEMPFEIDKQSDPFRSWTVDLADGSRMLTNGLGQLFDLYLCVVHK
jgi:SAM-dependent methyltransferase